jgi:hypothetical protein
MEKVLHVLTEQKFDDVGSKPEKCVFWLAVQNRASKHQLPGKQNIQKYAHINYSYNFFLYTEKQRSWCWR